MFFERQPLARLCRFQEVLHEQLRGFTAPLVPINPLHDAGQVHIPGLRTASHFAEQLWKRLAPSNPRTRLFGEPPKISLLIPSLGTHSHWEGQHSIKRAPEGLCVPEPGLASGLVLTPFDPCGHPMKCDQPVSAVDFYTGPQFRKSYLHLGDTMLRELCFKYYLNSSVLDYGISHPYFLPQSKHTTIVASTGLS